MSLTDRFFPTYKLTRDSGFTLLELMIVVTIAAILLGVAVPSFFAAIRSNRLTSYANELVTSLNLARSEAVKRGLPVTVRRVDNNSSTQSPFGANANWEDGWDVFVDQNGNGIFEDNGNATLCEQGAVPDDCLLKTYAALDVTYTLRGNSGNAPNNFTSSVRFAASGRSNTNGSFVICDDRDGNGLPEATTSRLIVVNGVGRVSMGIDTNNDGIPNTDNVASAASNIVSCTPI